LIRGEGYAMFKKRLFYRYSRLCGEIGVEVAARPEVAFQ
jgi:hypothetical protein